MDDDESSNKVSQHNNTVNDGDIVGGNKNIYNLTFFININLTDYQDFVAFITENESLILLEPSRNISIQEALNKIKSKYGNIVRGDKSMAKKNFSQNISEAATIQMERQQFGKAHGIFAAAIEDTADEHFNSLFKNYLITGFIHYCQENDMNGLKTLLTKGANSLTSEDPEIDLITANIFQEICSREADLDALNNYMATLEDIYDNAPVIAKSPMANSLGLAYRRLGERTGIELLQKAIPIFDEGLEFNKDNVVMEVDLKDQKAITYVRIFEFNKDISNLIVAGKLLTECVDLFEFISDPRGNRLKPRVLNNLGNVYKQKALFLETEKIKNAKMAISCYEDAEKFWSEPNAKYEWALLQKNKAEAKYALVKVTRDGKLLIDALKDCLSSVKYRDLENSPYQWGKSVEISFQIVLLLKELKSITLIPKPMREGILLYTQQIDEDNSKWGAKNFTNFLINAKQAQTLLKN
ncbi:hypothetical protein HDF24_07415 [Mucilaginibacter sp. X4EP1]|uniref:hypothetical protein n=1 Tax=Mucilaginibacter sp. X4EP1 TaxID=2723092 RepID=UPI00216A71C7|nr:hypothetical protein [Mucilaginibacter sp. X4EP1]MCS3814140.1 tetratricopeptide (TPR) repeat protein [Mucilaginibacter sp. X4EP1]